MASLKIWVVIYPSITLFHYLFGEMLSAFPLYVRTLILTLVLVPWTVLVGVPLVDWVMGQLGLSTSPTQNTSDDGTRTEK
ncbi:hypothetical protein [Flexibacter flexilis]|nr:hypothetical protein [Flexibacter flexilis]